MTQWQKKRAGKEDWRGGGKPWKGKKETGAAPKNPDMEGR